jgi:hypothetical protein
MTQNANSAQFDQPNLPSPFRCWFNNCWIQNCEERLTYGQEPYKIVDYWHKNKYWLKRKYKQQRNSK